MRRGRKIAFVYRVILAVMGGVALAAKTLTAAKVVDTPAWLQMLTGGVAAAMLFGDNIRTAILRYREPEWNATRDRIRLVLYGGIKSISEITQGRVAVEDLGISAWRKQGRKLPFVKLKLSRVERFRLSSSPQPSEVKWTLPKGVIGQAWQDQKRCHRDWRRINKKFASREIRESDFAALSAEERHGFSYREFRGFIGKYAEVLAIPIKNTHGAVVGVISVDLKYADPAQALYLDTTRVEEVLDGVATLVRDDLERLY